jgi:phosphoglucosamine mutase
VFSDHATTGDGLVAGLQVLAIMAREERPLSELSSLLTRVPQVQAAVGFDERRPVEDLAALTKALTSFERKLGKRGRILIRWSGTEPKLRFMVEGPDPSSIRGMLDDLVDAAKRDMAKPTLSKKRAMRDA